MAAGVKPPIWFWIAAILLVLWNAMGCYSCYVQFTMGPAAWGPVDDWSKATYARLPVWYNYVFLIATFGGLLGAFALLLREKRATILFWASLVAAVVQFGYVFAATDMVAHKGAAATIPFPLFIIGVCVFSVWLAKLATGKGWLGR